jgi:hypothetical protein
MIGSLIFGSVPFAGHRPPADLGGWKPRPDNENGWNEQGQSVDGWSEQQRNSDIWQDQPVNEVPTTILVRS